MCGDSDNCAIMELTAAEPYFLPQPRAKTPICANTPIITVFKIDSKPFHKLQICSYGQSSTWLEYFRFLRIFYKKYFKDVSREFDEFQVNTHLCKLRCWYLKYTIWVSFYWEGSYFVSTIMVSVGIFTLSPRTGMMPPSASIQYLLGNIQQE